MKRYMTTLAAAALAIGLVSVVHADSTSTAPQAAPSTMPSEQSAPAAPKETSHKHHKAAPAMKMAKVNLNSADKDDLMKVKGIDDATADKIIAARPITSGSELVKKGVITKAQWKAIARHVTVKKAS